MGKKNNHRRYLRSRSTPTPPRPFNRLHEIIVRRESREGRLHSSILHHASVLTQTLVNTPYLYNYPVYANNNCSDPLLVPLYRHQRSETLNQQLADHNYSLPPPPTSLPSFQPNSNIEQHSFAPIFDINNSSFFSSSRNTVDSFVTSASVAHPGRTNIVPFSPTSTTTIESQVANTIREYRSTVDSEPLPPRFNPTHPTPSSGSQQSSEYSIWSPID